jgi:hypothetical protein
MWEIDGTNPGLCLIGSFGIDGDKLQHIPSATDADVTCNRNKAIQTMNYVYYFITRQFGLFQNVLLKR